MEKPCDASLRDLQRFYVVLDRLKAKNGGVFRLDECREPDLGDAQGVYFFFEDGQCRSGSGRGQRVVRVGTSKRTLWKRISDHRGSLEGGGGHTNSVFRRHVAVALNAKNRVDTSSGWEDSEPLNLLTQRKAKQAEEAEVSRVIRSMSLLWVEINDEPTRASQRDCVEQNAIALLTTMAARALDPPSSAWLGHHSTKSAIQTSGLWNVKHVGKPVDPMFLDKLENLAKS